MAQESSGNRAFRDIVVNVIGSAVFQMAMWGSVGSIAGLVAWAKGMLPEAAPILGGLGLFVSALGFIAYASSRRARELANAQRAAEDATGRARQDAMRASAAEAALAQAGERIAALELDLVRWSGGSMTTEEERGIVTARSTHTVTETVERLSRVLQTHSMTIFATIDQKAAAEAAGLTMPPMVLFLFGNPKSGTPLMLAYPSIAIDLPLKALVWEDESDRVWVSYNSPAYLQRRHDLPGIPFQGIDALVSQALR
jgi:uncharacterized protein (DUF302 family)